MQHRNRVAAGDTVEKPQIVSDTVWMAKILIFGAGFLGTRLSAELPGATLSRTDATDLAAVRAELSSDDYSAVINAAGKTGRPNVDWCESHRLETFKSNVTGALVLAEAAAAHGAYLLHLASGCIFYGPSSHPDGMWREDDVANPSAFYSRTKYAADLVLSRLPNVGIARLRMPIDDRPGPRNLITKLAGYTKVIDVENSVTVIEDFIAVARGMIEQQAEGVFHVTNPGTMRHRNLLGLYRELVDPTHRCEYITPETLVQTGLTSKARSNCILASPRLKQEGIWMRPIDVALADAMEKYAAAAVSDRLATDRPATDAL